MISTLDISSVTDRILDYLTDSVEFWPGWTDNGGPVTKFSILVSGKMPETVRNESGCQVTLYLFHVNPDPSTRNSPHAGNRAQPNANHALGLTLYYLLSAYSKDSPTQEQQAMSIAIKALHERGTYVDPVDGFTFTITVEPEKHEEANRRWQSFSAPFRLSAVYRVNVVFLTPAAQPPAPAPPPQRLGLSLAPTALPFARAGALTATASRADFSPLNPAPGDTIVYDYSPAVVAPGGRFAAFGAGLDQPTAKRIYLIDQALVETEVTAWRTAAADQTGSRFVALLPNAVGAAPADSPPPGVYQLRVGSSTASGDAVDYRSNSVPLLVAARVGPVPSPWNPAGGVFTFTGAGFVAGATELYLDAIALSPLPLGSAPGAGEFAINNALDAVSFRPPAGIAPGTYFVRLRVGAVEGPAVGRIVLP